MMRAAGFTAVALICLLPRAADAGLLDAQDWYRRAESWTRSLFGGPAPDPEIIAPPAYIDRRMVLTPPARGTMRVIVPPARDAR